MDELFIDRKKTAIVAIDLQKGIAGRDTKPYSPKEVISNASKIINAFREKGMPVFLVHVNPSKETSLKPMADISMGANMARPPDFADFVPELGLSPGDIIITKHQWGAFYGTDLDMQLKRRKIETIVLCGIATSIGVESTARFAYEYGYNQIFAEDAMSSLTLEEHNSTINNIFRKMGRVRKTSEIIDALKR